MPIKKRSIPASIILSIVTCGIYGLYWIAKLNDEANELCGNKDGKGGALVILLGLVTCGIYMWFWYYKMGSQLDEKLQIDGKPAKDLSLLCLLLAIFGLGIVSIAIMQSMLNEYAE